MAAADAGAEGSKVGVGGWIMTSNACVWFAEMWDIQTLRQHWPFDEACAGLHLFV